MYIGHVASIQAAELSWARRFDRSAQQTAALMFTAIMSGRVGISGRELLSCAEHLAITQTVGNVSMGAGHPTNCVSMGAPGIFV